MYQKIVAQPNPVATLRCESGAGRDDKKSLLQRPSCQVISWLVSPAVKKSLLDQSQPARCKHNKISHILTPSFIYFLTTNLLSYQVFNATSRGQHSYDIGSYPHQELEAIFSWHWPRGVHTEQVSSSSQGWHRNKQPFTLSFTPTGNVGSLINLHVLPSSFLP